MKQVTFTLLVMPLLLGAADIWQAKPFTEWSDKDVQKLMSNSPWAHAARVSGGSPAPPDFQGTPTRSGRGGAGGADEDSAPAPISETNGAGRGSRGAGGGSSVTSIGTDSIDVTARWQSALPIKQALVRLNQAGKDSLDHPDANYVIVLSGPIRPFLKGTPDELKAGFMNSALLSAKGKSAIKPADVQINSTGRTVEVILSFPRSVPLTLDDKEIDLDTKLGDVPAHFRFRAKDMVLNGKLEL